MDSLRDKMSRVAATRKDEAEIASRRYNESSRSALFDNIQKKLQTSFIGALSQFESEFGYLWGGKDPVDTLTPEQRKMREKWMQTRTNVLNNGNNQVRAIQKELAQYTVTWNRHQMFLRTKEDNRDSSSSNPTV